MLAVGTVEDSIVITSVNDDTYAGDTNGNGGLTEPEPGDWNRMRFAGSGCGEGIMEYCIVTYGGSGGKGELCCENSGADPAFRNCRIEASEDYGIYCGGGAFPEIRYNYLIGDTLWHGVHNVATSIEIDAVDNWWGDDTGPYDPSEIGLHNPGGKGAGVSDYVLYAPWLSGVGPDLRVEPGAVTDTVLVDSVRTDSLCLANDGPAALTFEIFEAEGSPLLGGRPDLSGAGGQVVRSADVPWLSVTPTSGTITGGESMTVVLTFDANGLSLGAHCAYLVIRSNDDTHDPTVVPLELQVCSPAAVSGDEIGVPDVFYLVTASPYSRGDIVTLTFGLPRAGWLACRAYDIRGRSVATIVDQFCEAGVLGMRWQSADAGHGGLAPGLYVIRAEFCGSVATKKVVVIR